MKEIKQSFEIIDIPTEEDLMTKVERAARTCYKSENKITTGSAARLIFRLIESGHDAMLEHASITVKFITDRGVSHEIVRHRMASYAQESTRYCNYSKDKFGNSITVIRPIGVEPGSAAYSAWAHSCMEAEKRYFEMLEDGCAPQIARSVLPNCLKTEIVMTANIREWRHFLKLRTDAAAHPQIRELSSKLLADFADRYPVLFSDLLPEDCAECTF